MSLFEEQSTDHWEEARLISIINSIHIHGPVDPKLFEELAFIKRYNTELFQKYESTLIHVLGLFYKTNEPKNLFEKLYAVFSESISEDVAGKLTPVQASVLQKIRSNRYFSFSAPTSAGKSFLFREIVRTTQEDLVIVVPSRALISEYYRIVVEIVDKSVLVLQFLEDVNRKKTKRRVYIITPERGDELFKYINRLQIKLFLFDEAQISEEVLRGMRFDAFVRRVDKYVPSAKKVFTHPFVVNPQAQLLKHGFNQSASAVAYEQNSVGKLFLSIGDGKFRYFSPYQNTLKFPSKPADIVQELLKRGKTVMIFIGKGKIYKRQYIKEFSRYIASCEKITIPDARRIINELRDFIGAADWQGDKHSAMIRIMDRGIVFHHGSLPLKARLLIEEFVNKGYARICFATSTLIQGINMPFDLVWIDHFSFRGSETQKVLALKNLVGRAGRSTNEINNFEFGFVVIRNENVDLFTSRIQEKPELSNSSAVDRPISSLPPDLKDLAEAIQKDQFNAEHDLPQSQVERIAASNIDKEIKLVLNSLLVDGVPMKGADYYTQYTEGFRKKVRIAFEAIYKSHLRRKRFSPGEKAVLSTAIPILLWQIQGRSFKEIIALRFAYFTRPPQKKRKSKRSSKAKKIVLIDGEPRIEFSQRAMPLPDVTLKYDPLFRDTPISQMDYDILVYDTYDYLDKVISQSLSTPIAAAFKMYFDRTGDKRGDLMSKFIKYGTTDEKEIWLLRYGFAFEDIAWILPLVVSIDENEIVFQETIQNLEREKLKVIERYI